MRTFERGGVLVDGLGDAAHADLDGSGGTRPEGGWMVRRRAAASLVSGFW